MPSKNTYLVHPCGEQDGCEGARVRLGGRLGLQISVIWDFQKADESQRYLVLQSLQCLYLLPVIWDFMYFYMTQVAHRHGTSQHESPKLLNKTESQVQYMEQCEGRGVMSCIPCRDLARDSAVPPQAPEEHIFSFCRSRRRHISTYARFQGMWPD